MLLITKTVIQLHPNNGCISYTIHARFLIISTNLRLIKYYPYSINNTPNRSLSSFQAIILSYYLDPGDNYKILPNLLKKKRNKI